jgi:cell division protein FtsW (lipid II flippase)
MAAGTTPLGSSWQGERLAWPLLAEAALLAVVIASLLPLFAPLSAADTGRDGRFALAVPAVRGLPNPVLRELCPTYGKLADAAVRERLCARAESASTPGHAERLPAPLAAALARAQQALLAPAEQARARIAALRQQPGDAGADDVARAIDDTLAALPPQLRRHALDGDTADAVRPLACAAESLREAFSAGARAPAKVSDASRANAVLLTGAALDTRAGIGGLVRNAALPDVRARSPRCDGLDFRQSIAGTASLVAEARSTPVNAAKDDAMRELLHTARWQWAGWAVLGLLLLNLHRARVSPLVGVGLALAAWAAAAWLARVPWPLSGDAFVLARPSASFTAMPATFVVAMLAAAVSLLAMAPWLRKSVTAAPSAPASVFAYPGLVAATGIGWLLLLDLSANGNFGNRYLALYHQGHLWLGMLTFGVVVFLREPIGRGLAWLLSLVDGVASRIGQRLGALGAATFIVPLALLATAAIASLLANTRQLTSELGRLWLVVGAAWFFFMRGTPLTERLARSGNSLASLARYLWPLLFVVLVLIAAMFLTHDMGPLLIAGYGAGAFVAASVAMWLYQRRGSTVAAYAVAVVLFAAWIAGTTLALFKLGSIDQVTAERLENAGAPLVSVNDQLALVTWFRRAAPPAGFGPGAVPWCGFGASGVLDDLRAARSGIRPWGGPAGSLDDLRAARSGIRPWGGPAGSCAGVPAQIQSDYTFTALVGMFGWTAAWGITIGVALWLHEAVRPHGRASRGEPRLRRVGGRVRNDEQAFVSWLCVAWLVLVLCQLAVTVAGNLAVIPLTGVTFPFVSFGMTSLAVNMAMFALAIDVAVPDAAR